MSDMDARVPVKCASCGRTRLIRRSTKESLDAKNSFVCPECREREDFEEPVYNP